MMFWAETDNIIILKNYDHRRNLNHDKYPMTQASKLKAITFI